MSPFLPGEPVDWEFIPMAVRRALDKLELHLSLEAWRRLDLATRRELARLGSLPSIDESGVRKLVEMARPQPTFFTPQFQVDAAEPGPALEAIIADEHLTNAWRKFSPVARYALISYASRGRNEKARLLYFRLGTEESEPRG